MARRALSSACAKWCAVGWGASCALMLSKRTSLSNLGLSAVRPEMSASVGPWRAEESRPWIQQGIARALSVYVGERHRAPQST
eukprot:3379098-Prymnesium_polylepis.1